MRKKFMLPILIVAIVIQLLVPVGMIFYGETAEDDLQLYGKEFKVKVYIQHIVDGMIEYHFYDYYNWYDLGFYAVIEEDSEGYTNLFADVSGTKPQTDDYIRVTLENKAKLADFSTNLNYSLWSVDEEFAYLVIRVYKGNFEVVNLYIEDVPAEEWVKAKIAEEETTILDDEVIFFDE